MSVRSCLSLYLTALKDSPVAKGACASLSVIGFHSASAEWVAFLHTAVMAVAMCRVRNPACTAGKERYING